MGSPLCATLRVCFALDDGAFLTQTVFFGVFYTELIKLALYDRHSTREIKSKLGNTVQLVL